MDLDSLCMGCMEQSVEQDLCSSCGRHRNVVPDSPLHLPPGTVLAEKYLLGRVLGQGGFGITYLAFDTLLERKLAVKEYFPREYCYRDGGDNSISIYSGSTRSQYDYGLNKFLDEAKTLAMFDGHPNIIAIKDFFKANGTAYLIMNYLEGCTLKEYLQHKKSALPFGQTLDIMLPVMDALSHVHGEGLLHRDISPDNIFITRKGTIIVLDFGAARHALGENEKNMSIILKAGYAPEEQYRSSGRQGPWTDVYAVAATIYQVITGQMPPESLDRLDTDQLKTPSSLGIDINPAAEWALLKALAVKADDRYQTIDDFREAICNDRHVQQEASVENDTTLDFNSEPARYDDHYHVDPTPSGGDVYSAQELPDIQVNIGRHPENDYIITDEVVSRYHATIFRQSGRWYLEDRNSTGGTFLNGLRVSGKEEIYPGAEIKIGNTLLSFDGYQLLNDHGIPVHHSADNELLSRSSGYIHDPSTHRQSYDDHEHYHRENNEQKSFISKFGVIIGLVLLVMVGGITLVLTQVDFNQSASGEATSEAIETVADEQEETAETEQDLPSSEELKTGTIDYRGGVYTGELKDGRPHGHGVWVFSSGSDSLSFSGISSSSEQRYEGQWVDGKKHGQGRMVLPSGVVQVGIWDNDSYTGSSRD